MKQWFIAVLFIPLLLIAQACGRAGGEENPSGQLPPENTAVPAQTAPTGPTLPPPAPTSTAEYIDLADFSSAVSIQAVPEAAAPGEHIQFTSLPPFNGVLQIQGPDSYRLQAEMEAGKAGLDLPADAPAGVYRAAAKDPDGGTAFGSFRVADQPGIWLSIDRAFARPGHPAKIKVSSWGLSADTPVLLEVESTSGFSTARLRPDPAAAGMAPARFDRPFPLSDLVGTEWTLPEEVIGDLTVVVAEDEEGDEEEIEFASNTVEVAGCDTPSYIMGDLGEAGSLRAVWLEGGVRTANGGTQQGSFRLEAGPGAVLLQTWRTGHGEFARPGRMAVRVGCGETVDVGAADQSLSDSLRQAYPFLGLTLDDLGGYQAVSEGDLPFEHQGTASCTWIDGTLSVTFGTEEDYWKIYTLKAPGVSGSGEYPAVFDLINLQNGDVAGDASIKIEVDQVEDMMGVKGSFSANYSGEGGEGRVSGTFSCSYLLPLFSSRQSMDHSTALSPGGKKILAVGIPGLQPAGDSSDTCRSGIIGYPADEVSPSLGELLASALAKTAPRLSVLTLGDVEALLGLQAERQLLGGDEDEIQAALEAVAGAMAADYSFSVRMDQVGSQYVLSITAVRLRDGLVVARGTRSGAEIEAVAFSDLYQEIADRMRQADICGAVEPAEEDLNHGEELDINFTVTDLSGEPASGADVTVTAPRCGALEPRQGKTENGKFATTFKANQDPKPCSERLEFTAKTDAAGGPAETRPEEGRVDLRVSDLWALEMEMVLGEAGNTTTIQWSGSFSIEESGKLNGTGTGVIDGDFPDYPCVVLDFNNGEVRQEPNPTTLSGSFNFYIYGDATGEGENAYLHIDPVGISAPLVYSFGNPTCADGLTYDLFTGPAFSLAATQPLMIVGKDAIELEAKDGASAQYSTAGSGLPGTLEAALHRKAGE